MAGIKEMGNKYINMRGTVFLARGFYKSLATWHFVKVDALKLPLFLKQSKTGCIDVAEFGEVLFSGWGSEPPQDIYQKVDALFS